MKRKTRKLIENIRKSIKKVYPFLETKEQNEILEDFVYRSLLNEVNTFQSTPSNTAINPLALSPQDRAAMSRAIKFFKGNPNMIVRSGFFGLNPNAINYLVSRGVTPYNEFSKENNELIRGLIKIGNHPQLQK